MDVRNTRDGITALDLRPKARTRALRELGGRIFVGPPASAAVRAGAAIWVPALLGHVKRATFEGLALRIPYRDWTGRPSARFVEPHGILVQLPVWYLLARDLVRDAPRRATAALRAHGS